MYRIASKASGIVRMGMNRQRVIVNYFKHEFIIHILITCTVIEKATFHGTINIYLIVFNKNDLYICAGIDHAFKGLDFDGMLSETGCSHRCKPGQRLSPVTDRYCRCFGCHSLGFDVCVQGKLLPCLGPEHPYGQSHYKHRIYDGDDDSCRLTYLHEGIEA